MLGASLSILNEVSVFLGGEHIRVDVPSVVSVGEGLAI
jgi:hypothetical protein